MRVKETIMLSQEEMSLLNSANELLEKIYRKIRDDKLEDLLDNATTNLADIMENCEVED